MQQVIEQIRSLAVTAAEQEGLVLVDVLLRGSHNGRVLEVFVDFEKGVTTEMCAGMSRRLSRELDAVNLIPGNYTLVVSSPGVDRPLTTLMDYRRNIGRTLEVICQDGDMTKAVKGTLAACTDTSFELKTGDTSYNLPYDSVVRAKVVLPW